MSLDGEETQLETLSPKVDSRSNMLMIFTVFFDRLRQRITKRIEAGVEQRDRRFSDLFQKTLQLVDSEDLQRKQRNCNG